MIAVARPLVAALIGVILCPALATAQSLTVTADGDDALAKALRAASVLSVSVADDSASADDILAAAQADYRRMVNALYDRAYFGPTVSIRLDGREAAQIAPLSPPASVRSVVIDVTPGPRFAFGEVRVGPKADGTKLPDGFVPGQPARAEVIKDATAAAIDAWRQQGHAKAQVAGQRITANHRSATLSAQVTLAPGEPLRFGPLVITGTPNVPQDRLRHIAGLPVGQRYDPDAIKLATQRLRRTGTFRSVSLAEADSPTGDRLPIIATIEARKPRRIGAGVEYSTENGLTLSSFWLHRNVARQAQSLRFDAKISHIASRTNSPDYQLGVTFERPAWRRPENTLVAKAQLNRLDEPAFFLQELDLSLGVDRIVNQDFTLSVGGGLLTARARDALGERRYTLLTLPVVATLDRRDDKANPTRGYYLSAEATPFVGLRNGASGARAKWDSRGYVSVLPDDRVTLAGRVQLGSLLGAEADQAPANFLFYSGGGGTVRGQPYQSLGVETGGKVIGGRSMAVASAEARVGVTEDIGVVGFADWGMIGPDQTPGRTGNSHAGVGLGLRYQTGIGPIRFDVATPATGADAYGKAFFYIGIGQAF